MNKDNEFTDILRVQGINAKGYGILPKIPMQDQRLTPTAKLIYAYFCTFAGAGEVAFPSAKKIMYDLGIKDIDTFRKHRKQLENCGYINVEQSTKKGVFCSNVYTLISNPNPEIVDNSQHSPIPKKPVTEKNRNGKKPLPIKPVTKSNSSSKINSIIKNNQLVSSEQINTDELTNILQQSQIDLYQDEALKEQLKETIKELYIDTVSRDTVKKIDLYNIDEAISRYREAQEQKTIKNPKLYFKKCLLSAIEEGGLKNLQAII